MQTKRLLIRRIAASDWRAVQRIWVQVAKTEYARYDTPKDTADGAVAERIGRWASFAGSTEHMFFGVCLAETLIGYIALNRREGGYELGYCFLPEYGGRGYAKESISALLEALPAEEPLRITAGTALQNVPSVNLLLALGFRQTGTERVSFYRDARGEEIFFDGGLFERLLPEEEARGEHEEQRPADAQGNTAGTEKGV